MSGVNKVIIIGNLGNDPVCKSLNDGGCVANLSVATSESWKDANGVKQERTEWHRVVAFKKLAEIMGQYLHKGSKVYIEGKLQTRKWQDKETGADRYSTEIVASQMQMLDSRQEGAAAQPMQQQPYQKQAPMQTAQPNQYPQAGPDVGDGQDLPF